jgi:hypothetical protein
MYRHKKSAAQSLWMTHREPPPQNPIQFLTQNVWPWLKHYADVMFHQRAGFPPRSGNLTYPIRDRTTIALAADWGTGTIPAYKVTNQILSLEPKPDVTIHMGDVYYSGTRQEYEDWFLGDGDWPHGTQYTFAMNANHEMYSGGHGYFETALPLLRQPTSYFCLANDHWRIVALDTGYYSGIFPLLEKLWRRKIRLHDDILRWLEQVVFADATDRRPVILLTHHQPFSAFGGEYVTLGKNLRPYLDQVLLWFWGHEHRFAGYGPVSVNAWPVIRGRCIGHGGMPIEQTESPSGDRRTNLVFYDDRVDCELTRAVGVPVGYCGFAVLRLHGATLTVDYIDENGTALLHESWDASTGPPLGTVTAGAARLKVLHPAGLDALVQPVAAPTIRPAVHA